MSKYEGQDSNKEKRFEEILRNGTGFNSSATVIKDKQTGVLYLFYYKTNAGGLTVLVDKDGKPLVDDNPTV